MNHIEKYNLIKLALNAPMAELPPSMGAPAPMAELPPTMGAQRAPQYAGGSSSNLSLGRDGGPGSGWTSPANPALGYRKLQDRPPRAIPVPQTSTPQAPMAELPLPRALRPAVGSRPWRQQGGWQRATSINARDNDMRNEAMPNRINDRFVGLGQLNPIDLAQPDNTFSQDPKLRRPQLSPYEEQQGVTPQEVTDRRNPRFSRNRQNVEGSEIEDTVSSQHALQNHKGYGGGGPLEQDGRRLKTPW